MRYLELDEALKYEDEEFEHCSAVILHFVIYGRNAWNTTWVTKYFPGCMNPRFGDAKRTAEKKRVQGSVFYIRQIPALQFINKKLSVIITEINTDSPLRDYCNLPEVLDNRLIDIFEYFSCSRPNSVIKLIRHNEPFGKKSDKLSVSQNDGNDLELLSPLTDLKRYKSYSHGKSYLLGWKKIENKISYTAVQMISKYITSIIQGNS
jgi:hypothetical protein